MVKIIAEIGINHNGDLDTAKQLCLISKAAGCDYVKFQKRTPDICVPEVQKTKRRQTPWGEMSYLEYKKRIEFDREQVKELFRFCQEINIELFASVWDALSVEFMAEFTRVGKIPSALINDLELCRLARDKFDLLLVSTGMSTEEEIEKCIVFCKPDVVFHTNSTYPCPTGEINLNYIKHLTDKYPQVKIGYSGHEYGLTTTFAAVAVGAKWVERHVTLSRDMWGSDQKSSIEPSGIMKLVKGIHSVSEAMQYPPGKRILFKSELAKRESLRKK